jgi:hypothetical protein
MPCFSRRKIQFNCTCGYCKPCIKSVRAASQQQQQQQEDCRPLPLRKIEGGEKQRAPRRHIAAAGGRHGTAFPSVRRGLDRVPRFGRRKYVVAIQVGSTLVFFPPVSAGTSVASDLPPEGVDPVRIEPLDGGAVGRRRRRHGFGVRRRHGREVRRSCRCRRSGFRSSRRR